MLKISKILIALVATVIAIITNGCNKENNPTPATISEAKPISIALRQEGPLSLTDYKVAKNQTGNLVVKGLVSNTSTKKISRADAKFKLVDKDGNEIGETSATVENLEAQFSWVFEAVVANDATASAKFMGFTIK